MKRNREVAIILGAFKSAGLSTDDAVKRAIENGLKQVRTQKYADRHKEQINPDKNRELLAIARQLPVTEEMEYVKTPTSQK